MQPVAQSRLRKGEEWAQEHRSGGAPWVFPRAVGQAMLPGLVSVTHRPGEVEVWWRDRR